MNLAVMIHTLRFRFAKRLPNFICSLKGQLILMILHRDQQLLRDISKQVEKLMSMGVFPEDNIK